MRCGRLLSLIGLIGSVGSFVPVRPAHAAGPPRVTVGPMETGQGPKILSFYVRARADASSRANVYVAPSHPGSQEALFVVRVLDPDEDVVYWQAYHRAAGAGSTPHIFTEGPQGVPSAQGHTDELDAATALPLTSAGVYQIQVFSSTYTTAKLDLWDDDGYGLAMQPGNYHPWPTQPDEMWIEAVAHPTATMYLDFSIPRMAGDDKDLDVLSIVSPTLGEVFRAVGYEFDPIKFPGQYKGLIVINNAQVAPGAAAEAWHVDLPRAPYRFTVTGFPLVLCENAATAQAIGNSIRTVPADGEHAYPGALIDHKFQEKIADLMPELLGGAGSARALYALGNDYPYGGGGNTSCYDPRSDDEVFRVYSIVDRFGPLVTARWALGAEDSGAPNATWDDPNQIVDPDSFWLASLGLHQFERQTCPSGRDRECTAPGAICNQSGECSLPFDAAADRWDMMRHVQFKGNTNGANPFLALFGGNSQRYFDLPEHMGFAASEPHPCNAYFGHKDELYRRAAALVLFDLMALLQGYTYPDIANSTYSGHAAFRVRHHFSAFAQIHPDLDAVMAEMACDGDTVPLRECVREAWTYGMRALFDRYWVSQLESTMNQSAHFLLAFVHFVVGIDDGYHDDIFETYKDMAFLFAERFKNGANEAGWFEESIGPSPSYEGLTHWFMGMALHDMELLNEIHADDDYEEAVALALRQALVKAYDFHNHFAAREPGGSVALAGHNHGHRVADGLDYEQFAGAQGVIEDEAEIALWTDMDYHADEYRPLLVDAAEAYDQWSADGFVVAGLFSWYRFFDSSARPAGLELPHEAMARGSVRKIPADGSQLTAVRRGSYYAVLYAGQTAPIPFYTDSNNASVKAAPYTWWDGASWQIEDDSSGHNLRHYLHSKPMVGGGLSLLWTEDFGTSLIATNWSPLQHHGIVLEKHDPLGPDRYWEDYHAPMTILDLSTAGVDIFEITGALENRFSGTGGYTRRYEFHDTHIVVRVTIDTSGRWIDFSLDRAWENIPLATTTSTPACSDCGPWAKQQGSTIVDLAGCPLAEGEHALDAFALVDSGGAGMKFLITERPGGADQTIIVRPYGLRRQYYGDEQLQVGRVEIPFDADDYHSLQVLEYEIHPVQLSSCGGGG